jgi:hypothetical protein
MQTIQPQSLTNEELLRHVYLLGNENLPKEWVEALCQRLASLIDNPDTDGIEEEAYERGFEEGFAAGVDHANEENENK